MLVDDLFCGEGGDVFEVVWGCVFFVDDCVYFVMDDLQYGDVVGFVIEVYLDVFGGGVVCGDVFGVCGQDCLFDDCDEFVEGNCFFFFDFLQQIQFDVYDGFFIQFLLCLFVCVIFV